MPAVLKIVQLGDPALRRPAREITREELAAPRIQDLIARMRDTMRDAPGVGLAAPQVGESLQLAVIEDVPARHAGLSAEQLAGLERDAVPYHVIVNPRLQVVGDEVVEAFEGCLSFAGFTMVVPRARRVRVDGLDGDGRPFSTTATGWYARILQHEIDHLHGVVCCDRMDARTLMTMDNFAAKWRGLSIAELRTVMESA